MKMTLCIQLYITNKNVYSTFQQDTWKYIWHQKWKWHNRGKQGAGIGLYHILTNTWIMKQTSDFAAIITLTQIQTRVCFSCLTRISIWKISPHKTVSSQTFKTNKLLASTLFDPHTANPRTFISSVKNILSKHHSTPPDALSNI